MIFKNKASRPYSFHLQGVYDRSQAAGIAQTQASSAPRGAPGEAVPPGEARTYSWRITKKQGPTNTEFDCKAGAYYSTVDKVCTGLHLQPSRFMDIQHVHVDCPSVQYVFVCQCVLVSECLCYFSVLVLMFSDRILNIF